jgi:acetyl esterase/lipase
MLDLYIPDKPHTVFPLVVYVHGGSWVSGSKDEEAVANFLPTLAGAGYVVASINYRLAPTYTFPAQVDDVKCAIRFLRAHADDYSINAKRVGIVGESAGGYLAAFAGTTGDDSTFKTTAYTDQSDRVQAVVDISGPADFTVDNASATAKRIAYTFLANADPAIASPIIHVTANDPPFLILHGADDHVVPPSQSQHLQQALQRVGAPSQLILVHHAGHDLDVSNVEPSFSQLALTILSFLKSHLQ